MDPHIHGLPREPRPHPTDMPAPRRTSPLDDLPVSAVLRVITLRVANRHGAFGPRDGEREGGA